MSNSPANGASTVVIHEPRRPRLWGLLGWIGFLVCGIILLSHTAARHDYLNRSKGLRERLHSGSTSAADKVAILHLSGVIVQGDGFVKRQIDRIREDRRVKAVVVRINTPGGTITGSDYLYHHLKKLREDRDLPMVVSMGSIATSGGYYFAMAAKSEGPWIYAEPTTTTGSIGVIVPHFDVTGLMEELKIKDDSIMSHPHKQMLAMTRPIDEEERKILQGYVDESFGRFKEIVAENRPALAGPDNTIVDPDTGEDLATGEIFTATQALRHGLVDELGFLEAAIDRAIEAADLNKERVRVIEYQRPFSWTELVGFAQSNQRHNPLPIGSIDWEMLAPRGYYLTTTLPPLMKSW